MKRLIFLNDINNREAAGSPSVNPVKTFFINNNGFASYFVNFIRTNDRSQSGNIDWTRPTNANRTYRTNLQSYVCNNILQALQGILCFTYSTEAEKQDIITNFQNFDFKLSFSGISGGLNFPFLEWLYHGSDIVVSNSVYAFDCLLLIPYQRNFDNNIYNDFVASASNICSDINSYNFSQNCDSGLCFSELGDGGDDDDCLDSRSSSSTSEFFITINGLDIAMNLASRHYNLLIQPDPNHTSGTISLSDTDGLYTSFLRFDGASVRMVDDVCCHGAGYIEIRGDVHISGLAYNEVMDVLIPYWYHLDESDVLFLRANFEDSCCCYATSYSESLSDLINDFLDGVKNNNDGLSNTCSVSIEPKTIKWSGFERLSDFCCDDSDCSDINDYDYQIEIPSSESGGGGSVDISCICDNLHMLNETLSAFRSDNKNALDSINETLSSLELTVDNDCVCDNLVEINDSLGSIKSSIDDKELSVDNEITVSPCQPIITNPVNNITVTPSTAEINVEPCSPVVQVTNPVNNITVTPSTAEINVEPCSPVVQVTNPVNNITVSPCQPIVNNVVPDIITVDNDTLNDKLDELFKKDGDTITDIVDDVFKTTYQGLDGEMHTEDITEVIRNKQCENVVECIVEPVNMAYEGKGKYIDKDILDQN